MSTHVPTQDDYDEARFVELEPAYKLTKHDLRSMADADVVNPTADETHRHYAVARINGVEHYGPDVTQERDACHILYLDPARETAVERRYYNVAGDFEAIPRALDVPAGHPAVDEPSEGVLKRFGVAIQAHAEVEG